MSNRSSNHVTELDPEQMRSLIGVALGGQEPPENLPVMSHAEIDRWALPYLG